MAQVTAKVKLNLKDVRNIEENLDFFDRDQDIYFTVSSDSLAGVNNEIDETVRDFIAKANLESGDRAKIEKFIK